VGYGKLFPELNLTVVGSRPFSWVVRFGKCRFYQERFEAILRSPQPNSSEQCSLRNGDFLGHNGPVGLGDRAEDPVAKIGNR